MGNKLNYIFDNEKVEEIISFLRSLDKAQRNSLVPIIKQQHKDYYENRKTNQDQDWSQSIILSIEMFVCFNLKDYKQYYYLFRYSENSFIRFENRSQQELRSKIKIEDILEWYVPEWLDDFLNNSRLNTDYAYASYGQLISWMQKGYISKLTPELLAYTLCEYPYEVIWDEDYKRHTTLHPQRLLECEITLKEHIWLLFQYSTLIWMDRGKDYMWNNIFRYLLDNKHIDRIKLFKEILLTANRNLNKLENAFFINLFDDLEPSDDDLLALQSELLSVLTSSQSKAVNSALGYIKRICTLSQFQSADFVANLSILLSFTTKATINTTIDITSKLLEKDKSQQTDICLSLCQGFVNKDESVQKKLAKVLSKYGHQVPISDTLQMYANNILASVRPLLDNIMTDITENVIEEEPICKQAEKKVLIRTNNKIEKIDNFDDFLFFINQAFSNNEPYHVFMLPVYLSRFNKNITADNVSQLGSTCKAAKNCIGEYSDFNETFACFFLSYINYLHSKYPDDTIEMMDGIGTWYQSLDQWVEKRYSTILYPYYHILQEVIKKIREEKDVQLLSTPTHAPLWIDPIILVERIAQYQNENIQPDSIDLQMAIRQTALDNTETALLLAKKKLKGELKDLIIYLLDSKAELPTSAEHSEWWITASLTKKPYTIPTSSEICKQFTDRLPQYNVLGNYTWEIEMGRYNKQFKVDLPEQILDKPNVTANSALFEYTFGYTIWGADIQRHIYTNPYSHGDILSVYLSSVENLPSFTSNDKKGLMGAILALYELELPFVHADYLLLTWAMLCADKVSKDFAGELWAKATSLKMIDNGKLGKYVQEFVATGEFPIKRLNDLIENNLINFGMKHQKELIKLISSILIHQEEPITNLKKLLEIYSELLAVNGSATSEEVKTKLKEWENNSTLKKTIKALIQ